MRCRKTLLTRFVNLEKPNLTENGSEVSDSFDLRLSKDLQNQAMAKHKIGDMYAAINLYSQACKTLENVGKPNIEITFTHAAALNALAAGLSEVGEYDKAMLYAERSLELRKGLLGKKHLAVGESLTTIGTIQFAMGRLSRACESFESALTVILSVCKDKEDSPIVALAFFNVGIVYIRSAELRDEGIKALKKSSRIAESVFGPNHPQTLIIKSSILDQ